MDCDLETALSYAAKIPAAEGGTIEIRPLTESPCASKKATEPAADLG